MKRERRIVRHKAGLPNWMMCSDGVTITYKPKLDILALGVRSLGRFSDIKQFEFEADSF